ncbi:hypothetical protein MKX03_037017 [Papaver bracteatum]|nr:hypothetical protein MKX03_037017 [Papaver bracteatum]
MRSSSKVGADVPVRLSSPVLPRDECPCVRMFLNRSDLLGTAEVGAKEVSLNIEGGKDQDWEAAEEACGYHSSGAQCYVGDQCHHPGFWTNRNKDHILEMVLKIISFLLTFSAVGAFSFTQAITPLGSQDPVLKLSLVAFNVLFAASFFCNFLAALILLILQSHPEYFRYKKFSLIISNTVSFALLILGYGFVIAFNIQHR